MADVVLKNIRKSFGKLETIHGVDLLIRDGEFVVFVGPSGCGKSTLLRLIAGLEDISAGEIFIDGEKVNARSPKERGIAMVFQSYALYPHMNVYQNMAFGLQLSRVAKDTIDEKVRKAADLLELTPLLERLPKQMSGGQRQRVAIGRAIVREPKVFLFDEPLSNLDAALRVQMRIEIAKLHKDMKATMIYVTHDQVEAMTLADKIVVLNAGNVEQVGAPLELYHNPRNLFVAGFIGSPQMNFTKGIVKSSSADLVEVKLSTGEVIPAHVAGDGVRAGDAVTVGVRPEHLVISDDGPGFSGVIEVIEQLGESHFLYVRLGDGTLMTVREAGDAHLETGRNVIVAVDPAHTHVFDATGNAIARVRHTLAAA